MLMSADGPPRERAGVGGGGEERDPVTREVKRGKDGDGGGAGRGGAEKTVWKSQEQTPGDGATRRPRRPRHVPLPTSKPEMSGHLRASHPRSNAARTVFGDQTSKCLREEGGGQTGGRGRREDSHRRRENGTPGDSKGH